MTYQKPITIAEAVRRIETGKYLLPDIQRTFVWRRPQIIKLFDSAMRGYPLGSLLVWRTRVSDHPKLRFRHVVRNYEGSDTHLKSFRPPAHERVDAVLDGQQRLTALNIGLCGSHDGAHVVQPHELHIDLSYREPGAGAEQEMYRFEFLTGSGAESSDGEWFPVREAFGARANAVEGLLAFWELSSNRTTRSVLAELIRTINAKPMIPIELEQSKDLDRVLNIFARTNMGGTKLTYTDLLVSTATARWRTLKAAEEIESLVDDMNAVGSGFGFSVDRVVKSGLVILGSKEPKFHVDAFLQGDKAQQFEQIWPKFRTAMMVAVKTLDSFGLSGRSLAGSNVVVPIAYYAYHRKLRESYATADAHERDRRKVRAFVARTLLQRAYWTGAVDPVLVAARKAIKAEGASSFPLARLEKELKAVKPITVSDALIDELTILPYRDRRTIVLLRLLFPELSTRPNVKLDKDHIFPTSKINANQVSLAGLPPAALSHLELRVDRLPNLQLVDQPDNINKSNKMPLDWYLGLPTSARRKYTQQGIKYLPVDLAGADAFWDKRHEMLRKKIKQLLMA